MFVKLSEEQLKQKINFIENFIKAKTVADGSIVDSNANVSCKNVATLQAELNKDINIQVNRKINYEKIKKLFDHIQADKYLYHLRNHITYVHDESSVGMPYTYSAKEAVHIIYNNESLLISMEELYDKCKEPEDEIEPGINIKIPLNMYCYDKDGNYTKITRLVQKERKRDIVRVKTAFGEDLYVTDNHPLIVENDKSITVPALDSKDKLQYKNKNYIKFKNNLKLDLNEIFQGHYNYQSYILNYGLNEKIQHINTTLNLTEEFGYFVGFFIGDGHYLSSKEGYFAITQIDDKILIKLADILYRHTGIPSKIYKEKLPPSHISEGRNPKFVLHVNNIFLTKLLLNHFKINHLAQNKNIPVNIFETNEEFAKGIIAGLSDSDGTFHNDKIIIRLASRYCISQLQTLLKYFDCTIGTSYQAPRINDKSYIKQSYPMFGISFDDKNDYFKMSFKIKTLNYADKYLKYAKEGWVTITDVYKIDNEYFLKQNNYIYDITTESNTFVMNNLWVHNCVSISLYPFLLNGLKSMNGESETPKHLYSFCGGIVNLLFALSSQFAGACSTPEWLICMDYFAKKDFGEDYLTNHSNEIKQSFQHIIYCINQPAAARSYQTVFWNISIFDKFFMEEMFKDFVFPDNKQTKVDFVSVNELQKFFLEWFNKEREKSILTFPIITVAMLNENNKPKDTEFSHFIAEQMAKGNLFFLYQSDNIDGISSCCRLRSEIKDKTFSYTMGSLGVMTGSIHVITLNVNRFIQKCWMNYHNEFGNKNKFHKDFFDFFKIELRNIIQDIHKYHHTFREIMKEFKEHKLLPAYESNFITLEKQFSTIGINGFVEAAEFLGLNISNNYDYIKFASETLEVIFNENKEGSKRYNCMFNTEFVPAENLGVKNAKWDHEDDYHTKRDCYNSYFYIVEDDKINIIDKFILHGDKVTKYLDGGSACHINLQEHLSKEQYLKLMEVAAKTGCNFWCVNVKSTMCNDPKCNHIDKKTLQQCSKCGNKDVSYLTRIIGYLKRIDNFSSPRQIEESQRFYHKG